MFSPSILDDMNAIEIATLNTAVSAVLASGAIEAQQRFLEAQLAFINPTQSDVEIATNFRRLHQQMATLKEFTHFGLKLKERRNNEEEI